MKIFVVKSVSIASAFVLSLGIAGQPAYAAGSHSGAPVDGAACTMGITGPKSVLLRCGGGATSLSVSTAGSVRTVRIKDLGSGKQDYVTYDESSGRLYSSITGKSIQTTSREEVTDLANRSRTTFRTYYFSYADIRSASSDTLGVVGFVSLLMTRLPSVGNVASLTGMVATAFNGPVLFIPQDPHHGIAVRVGTTRHTRTRLGKPHVYKITHHVDSVWRY